jgi:hypothetical protein
MAIRHSTQMTVNYLHLRHIDNGKTPLPMWSWLDGVMRQCAYFSIIIPAVFLFAAAIAAALAGDLTWRGAFVIFAIMSLACLCARLPLLGSMVIIFLILVFNEYGVEQFWTQADDLAFYVYNAWWHFFPKHEFGWLKINTIDVLILAVAIGLLFAVLRQRVILALAPQSVLVIAFALAVVGMFFWGVATGGELGPAAWQVRPYLQMAAIALLLPQVIRNTADLRFIVWTLVVAITVKAAQIIWIFFFLAEGHFGPDWRELVDHADSIFLVACFGFLLALFIYDNHLTKRLVLSILSATTLAALIFNLRRAGYVALGLTVLLTPLVVYGHRRSALKIVAALSAIVLCLAVFGHDQGTVGLVVQKLRTSFDGAAAGTQDYYSNFYRYGENLNLWQAIISNPLGTGFGKPLQIEVPLDHISAPLWQYFPHNMILGMWMSLGTIVFIVFLTLIAEVMVAANFFTKEASDPFIKAVSVFCVMGLAVALLAGTVDQFMSSQRSAIFVGVIIGLGSAISLMHGHKIADLFECAKGLPRPTRTRRRNQKAYGFQGQ